MTYLVIGALFVEDSWYEDGDVYSGSEEHIDVLIELGSVKPQQEDDTK